MKKFNIAIVGATGAVGETMLNILSKRKFPINNLKLLASRRSVGKEFSYNGKQVFVEELTKDSFKDIDIALFSAGGNISKEFAPIAAKDNCVVIDNSSYFRMEKEIPLVVPEVNPEDIKFYKNKNIIANPNCTTIIMCVALKPIYNYSKIKKVIVSSYQSASGAGAKGINELENQTKLWSENKEIKKEFFAHQLLFNVIPHVDKFEENGYTKEEMKMFFETKKIMHDDDIAVSATCVRVPVLTSHSESITLETEDEIEIEKIKELFSQAQGLEIWDDPSQNLYPMPLLTAGKDNCFVGRLRKDIAHKNSISFWVCGDQLRKGAALNAVQIAEKLIENYL